MNKQREALEEALEILGSAYAPTDDYSQRVIALIEEALSEPTRKPLTDEEIDALFNSQAWVSVVFFDAYGKPLERASSRDFARAIERAHGIGSD